VIANRSFCSVWSREFSAFLRSCLPEVHEPAVEVPALVLVLVEELPVAVEGLPVLVGAPPVLVGVAVGVVVRDAVGLEVGVDVAVAVSVEVRVVVLVAPAMVVDVDPPDEGALARGASNAWSTTPLHALLAFVRA
jgi:hypothetical protein